MREYFCAYHSMLRGMRRLSDAECGRLFRALLDYSQNGTEPINLQGREEALFDVYADQIDRDSEKYESKCKQMQANATKCRQTLPNAGRSSQDKDKGKDKDKDKGEYTTPLPPPGEKAAAVTAQALDILPHMTPKQMEELASYREDMPDELIGHALDIAADNTRTWAYVKGILNRYMDEGINTLADAEAQEAQRRQKKRDPAQKTALDRNPQANPAQDYPQREYTDEEFDESFFIDLSKYGG